MGVTSKNVVSHWYPLPQVSPAEVDVGPRAGGQEQAHDRLRPVPDRVHGVEDGRVTVKTELIESRRRVNVGSGFDQGACRSQIPVLRGDVEQGDTDEGRKCGGQGRPMFEQGRGCGNGRPDRVGVVQSAQARRLDRQGSPLAREAGEGSRQGVPIACAPPSSQ